MQKEAQGRPKSCASPCACGHVFKLQHVSLSLRHTHTEPCPIAGACTGKPLEKERKNQNGAQPIILPFYLPSPCHAPPPHERARPPSLPISSLSPEATPWGWGPMNLTTASLNNDKARAKPTHSPLSEKKAGVRGGNSKK